MKKLLFLVLVIFLTGCNQTEEADFEKGEYKIITEANNRFAFDLLKELSTSNEQPNLFFSPTSIHMALSMAYNGAAGDTKNEMAQTLHIQDFETNEVNQSYASFLNKISDGDFHATLDIANSIWLRKGYLFTDDFVKNTKDYYLATFEERDFSDASTVDEINKWVQKNTNNKIDQIIEGNIHPDTISYLINAIYFKGDWQYAFDEKLTYEESFHLDNGQVKQHPFMKMNRNFNYFEDESLQAIELPYKDNELSMVVLLPKDERGLAEINKQVSYESWNSWMSQFSEKEGDLFLPKFTLEYEATLNGALANLGMENALSNFADFSNMVMDERIYIDEVKHKSFVDVNEKGTEAAAVTSVEMKVTSFNPDANFTMKVNRPFFFAIQDNESGTILFMGEVSEPILGN